MTLAGDNLEVFMNANAIGKLLKTQFIIQGIMVWRIQICNFTLICIFVQEIVKMTFWLTDTSFSSKGDSLELVSEKGC